MVDYPFPPSQLLDGVSEVLEKFTFQESVNIGSISLEDLSALGKAAQRLIEAALYFEQNVNLCLVEKYSSEGLETVKLLNTVLVPRAESVPENKKDGLLIVGSDGSIEGWNSANAQAQ